MNKFPITTWNQLISLPVNTKIIEYSNTDVGSFKNINMRKWKTGDLLEKERAIKLHNENGGCVLLYESNFTTAIESKTAKVFYVK